MNELISIIVPVYNVEEYINICLDSICAQTYENLEIILVDDGSTDKSGAICDEYSHKDKRIKVIHKENMGVSDSRNKGLSTATGDYIGFVDSDDWIAPNMYRLLYEGIKVNQADISICGHTEVYNDKLMHHPNTPALYNNVKALEELVKGHSFRDYLWNKLFCKKLFDTIEFPVGRTMEDKAIMYRLFDRSRTIVYLSEVLYYYRKWPGSICNSKTLMNRYGNYKAEYERYAYLSVEYPMLEGLLFTNLINSSLLLFEIASYEKTKSDIKSQLRDIKTFYFKNLKKILKADISKIYKILILILIINKSLFRYSFKVYRSLQKNERIRKLKYKLRINK